MAQNFGNIQTQEQQQVQNLSPQQVLTVRMLEMPIQELEQRVQNELMDNPALEVGQDEDEFEATPTPEDEGEDLFTPDTSVLHDSEDDDGDYESSGPRQQNDRTPVNYEQTTSNADTFQDQLLNQIGEYDVTDRQRLIIEYLIGNLDDDGLLRKDLYAISDDLLMQQNLDVTEQEIEECLHILQQFDPAGIGARTLQECLLLQVDRQEGDVLQRIKHRILKDCFEEFKSKRWDKIAQKLGETEEDLLPTRQELSKLNPRPGSSLGESGHKNLQSIIPDFLVTVDDDDHIQVTLNNEHIPSLHISESFAEVLNAFSRSKDRMTRTERDQMTYIKQKVDSANGFINAIKSRHATMLNTMQSIIHFQREFFLEGDKLLIKPLTMKEVAARARVDLSTVSRVCSSKYVDTPYGIFSLKEFFADGYQNTEGEDVSTRVIRDLLREMIENEDKKKPLTDERLTALMKAKGYDLARRTVAKYRDQLGIPVARLRK